MPATLSVGVRPMPAIVAATSKDVAWLLPRDPRDATPALLPRSAQISFNREGRVDNLRASPRLDVQLPVQVNGAGAGLATTTVNLSAGGALLAGTGFGAADSTVEVEIALPQDTVVKARGKIVRVHDEATGIRFSDLAPADQAHIDSMVLSVRAQLARRFAELADREDAARSGKSRRA
jgi:hypothetical protein